MNIYAKVMHDENLAKANANVTNILLNNIDIKQAILIDASYNFTNYNYY